MNPVKDKDETTPVKAATLKKTQASIKRQYRETTHGYC